MKNSKKISERYVAALFSVAASEAALPAVENDLVNIAKLLKEDAKFADFIVNPLLTRAQKGNACAEILKYLKAHQLTVKFMLLLAAHKRLELIPEMVRLFVEKTEISRGELAAELVSTRTVSAAESAKVAEKLGKIYNKKINLRIREDASLLGGVVINIGSTRLDSSLSGKLNRLRQVLKAA